MTSRSTFRRRRLSRFWHRLALSLGALLAVPSLAADAPSLVSIAAEGTQFRLTMSNGTVHRSPDLTGAKLIVATESGPRKILIAKVERDPTAKTGDVWLHTLMVEQPDGTTQNLCEPGPDGRAQAFPSATALRADGSVEQTAPETFELICTAGARAKCIRFGYRPWEPAERDMYQACTRMVRADYCGAGEGTTRNGMSIDLYDDRRIQTPENSPSQAFEAGWRPNGAVCVHHVRVQENISLERLMDVCPRLRGKTGAMCTEDAARSSGAVLFNRSKP